MHPVFRPGPAAEHSKAMTAAGKARPVRQARRARRRKDEGRTGRRAAGMAGRRCPQPGDEPVKQTDSPSTSPRLLAASRVRGLWDSCVIVGWLEGNAHAAGNR